MSVNEEGKHYDRLYMPTHILETIAQERKACLLELFKVRSLIVGQMVAARNWGYEQDIHNYQSQLAGVDRCIGALTDRDSLIKADPITKGDS